MRRGPIEHPMRGIFGHSEGGGEAGASVKPKYSLTLSNSDHKYLYEKYFSTRNLCHIQDSTVTTITIL